MREGSPVNFGYKYDPTEAKPWRGFPKAKGPRPLSDWERLAMGSMTQMLRHTFIEVEDTESAGLTNLIMRRLNVYSEDGLIKLYGEDDDEDG